MPLRKLCFPGSPLHTQGGRTEQLKIFYIWRKIINVMAVQFQEAEYSRSQQGEQQIQVAPLSTTSYIQNWGERLSKQIANRLIHSCSLSMSLVGRQCCCLADGAQVLHQQPLVHALCMVPVTTVKGANAISNLVLLLRDAPSKLSYNNNLASNKVHQLQY